MNAQKGRHFMNTLVAILTAMGMRLSVKPLEDTHAEA
jgi:DNA-binding phage protein